MLARFTLRTLSYKFAFNSKFCIHRLPKRATLSGHPIGTSCQIQLLEKRSPKLNTEYSAHPNTSEEMCHPAGI